MVGFVGAATTTARTTASATATTTARTTASAVAATAVAATATTTTTLHGAHGGAFSFDMACSSTGCVLVQPVAQLSSGSVKQLGGISEFPPVLPWLHRGSVDVKPRFEEGA